MRSEILYESSNIREWLAGVRKFIDVKRRIIGRDIRKGIKRPKFNLT
jgi:hypothetical protein